jgi:hypothetical protein
MKIPVPPTAFLARLLAPLLALSSLVLLLGCSATKTTDSGIRIDAADASAAAALQLYFQKNDSAQALKLLQKATKQSPKRAEISWLHFTLCAQVLNCNTGPIEAELGKLDPGNGAVRLGALARAQRDGDEEAAAVVLDSISRSQKFQIYWNSLISKLARASVVQAGKRPQPVSQSLNEIMDWYSKLASAAFGPVLVACSVQRATADATTNARCIRIAGLLLQGDTYIGENVGLRLAKSLLGAERAEQIAERTEASQYQRDTASEIINAQVDREALSVQLLELMGKLPREQDVFAAVVSWGGGDQEQR